MPRAIRSMTTLIAAVLVTVALSAQEKPAPDAKALDVSGKWAMTLNLEMGPASPALVLKQAGEKLTGTYTGRYGEFQLTGTLKGKAIQFGLSMSAEGTQVSMSFKGEVAADAQTMKGDGSIEGLGDFTWSAVRPKN